MIDAAQGHGLMPRAIYSEGTRYWEATFRWYAIQTRNSEDDWPAAKKQIGFYNSANFFFVLPPEPFRAKWMYVEFVYSQ